MSLIFLVPDEDTKPHIPNFPKFAGGFADRLKGLLFALHWSATAGVPLKVYWQSPIPLTQIFDLKSEQLINLSTAEVLRTIGDKSAALRFINWVDLGGNEIQQNMQMVDLHDHTTTHVLFANQFNAPDDHARKNALHQVFNKHLAFKSAIRERAENILPLLKDKRPDTTLLGMQLRIGKHVGAGWDDPFLDSKLNWRLMRQVAANFCIDVKNYVFLSDAAELQFGQDGLTEFKPKWSSENIHFELSKNSGKEKLLDTIAQFYLLSCCSHVVHGKGEFGYLAAALGGGVSVDYVSQLNPKQKKRHKWNHRFSRWRISLAKRLTSKALN